MSQLKIDNSYDPPSFEEIRGDVAVYRGEASEVEGVGADAGKQDAWFVAKAERVCFSRGCQAKAEMNGNSIKIANSGDVNKAQRDRPTPTY